MAKYIGLAQPGYLSIQLNGASQVDYDGSSRKIINITAANIGAAATSHGTHVSYGTTTTALTSGGTGIIGTASTIARSDHTHTLPAYPTSLKNPNPLNFQLNGVTEQTYDGSSTKTINITPTNLGAAPASHSHAYVPLSGGTLTGNLTFANYGASGGRYISGTMADDDFWRLGGFSTQTNNGYFEIATADNASEPIYVRQYRGSFTDTPIRTVEILDEVGNTSFPGTVTAPTFSGNLTGTASSANATPWVGITGKPSTFAPSAHTHTKSQITDFPATLPSPTSLTISLNGTSQGAYDGSTAKAFNITPSSIGAAPTDHGTHVSYGTTTTALTSGGTGVVGSAATLSRSDHTHTLPAYPTALKNPTALTLQIGPATKVYDGSTAQSFNITADDLSPLITVPLVKIYEKADAGTRYTKIFDAQCNQQYHRICQSFILQFREQSAILTVRATSANSTLFGTVEISYTALTVAVSSIIDTSITAGIVKVSDTVNKVEIWYKQNQWGQSLGIIPLSANVENLRGVIYGISTTGGITTPPTFDTEVKVLNTIYYVIDPKITPDYNKVAMWDSALDLNARLFKSTYNDQTSCSGAIAFRVNSSTDNYIRFCSDPTAIRNFIGSAATSHTHTKSQITDFPTALKNPTALTIQCNGATKVTYDGAEAKTVNIVAGDVGAAPASHGTHVSYGTATTALTSGGTGVVGSAATVARTDHTHTLPAYPTALPNPTALTISLNGTSQGAYDGSTAKAINVTPGSIGAAASSHTHTKSQISDFPASLPANGGTATSANYININNTEVKNSGRFQFFQSSSNATLMPDTGWWSLLRTQHNGYDVGYWQETAYSFSGDVVKYRRNVNGALSAWRTFIFDNDSRLSDARPASDVSAWAKASVKPPYSYSEISGTPSALKNPTALTISLNGTSQGAYDGSAAKSFNITAASVGAAATSHIHTRSQISDLMPFTGVTIPADYATKYRTSTRGNANAGDYLSVIRCDEPSAANAPQNGTGLAWGRSDTHGYLYCSYGGGGAFIGAGNADKLNWIKQLAFTDSNISGSAGSVAWVGVTGKPSTFTPSSHTHTVSQITDFPTALKNPTALTISLNGTSQGAYDGSTAKDINITPASIGAAASSHGTHVSYGTTTTSLVSGGTGAIGTAGTVARSDHTHTLPAYPSALKCPTQFAISLNGGLTEGTSLFTYDGSTAKSVILTPASIGAADASHTHTKSQITDFPSYLPNPSSLIYKLGTGTETVYDGSNPKTLYITPAAIGAAAESHGTHVTYGTTVSPLAPGTTGTAGSSIYVSRSDHCHTLPAYPTTLANPYALNIYFNGAAQGAYTGSATRNIYITASAIGAAAATHTHGYAAASHTHQPGDVIQNATNRFITDTERTNWNGAVYDSGWVSIDPAVSYGNFKLFTADNPIRIRRYGQVVQMTGEIVSQNNKTGSGYLVNGFTIPEQFRPPYYFYTEQTVDIVYKCLIGFGGYTGVVMIGGFNDGTKYVTVGPNNRIKFSLTWLM